MEAVVTGSSVLAVLPPRVLIIPLSHRAAAAIHVSVLDSATAAAAAVHLEAECGCQRLAITGAWEQQQEVEMDNQGGRCSQAVFEIAGWAVNTSRT